MDNPWEKRPTETKYAFGAFACYLELGSKRTLRACAEAGGYSATGVRKWSARHDWDNRATAYDIAMLQRSIEGREQVRERARQVMMDDAEEAARTLGAVMRRTLKLPECDERCTEEVCHCGLRTPIFDRHGEHVGDRATVTPAEARAAALAVLDRCGMTPPKRVELTGADGERLRLEAQLALGSLSNDRLAALLAAFAPNDDGD
jgi:hypothetical protein